MAPNTDIERRAEEKLLSLLKFGIKLGLEQTRELFSLVGSPERKLKFIHVAGTNGKGSVCAMIAAGLTAAGFRTGLYSSPHLARVRERFRIDGKALASAEFAELTERLAPAMEKLSERGMNVTYFEATTALAALAFENASAEFAVWETGMGGRFDATNVVTPEISVITTIALDHTTHLGASLAEIAFEKAGIIKPGVPVVCGRLPDEAMDVVMKRAEELNAPLLLASPSPADDSSRGFRGENAETAKLALKHLSAKFAFSFESAAAAAEKTKIPGRYHEVGDSTIVDGAHNPAAAAALVERLKADRPDAEWTVVFTALDDKDAAGTAAILAEIAEKFVVPELRSTGRAVPAAKLAETIVAAAGIPAEPAPNVETALRITEKAPHRLITGSLYLAGEALELLVPLDEITDIAFPSPSS